MLIMLVAVMFGRRRVFERARGRFVVYRFRGRNITFALRRAS